MTHLLRSKQLTACTMLVDSPDDSTRLRSYCDGDNVKSVKSQTRQFSKLKVKPTCNVDLTLKYTCKI